MLPVVECVVRSVKRSSLTCLSHRKDFAESGQEAENELFEEASGEPVDLKLMNNFARKLKTAERFFKSPCLVGKKTP